MGLTDVLECLSKPHNSIFLKYPFQLSKYEKSAFQTRKTFIYFGKENHYFVEMSTNKVYLKKEPEEVGRTKMTGSYFHFLLPVLF